MAENTMVKQTILEEGTEIEGAVRSKCAIVVSGQVKGEISAPTLTVTESGLLNGKVKAAQLSSHGSLAGEIDADNVELAGTISDNTVIRANTLEVKLNQNSGKKLQVSFGNCELQVGNPNEKQDQKQGEPAANGKNKPEAKPQ
jgi:cytoskeletal protein CcmA (bactofilin family)